MLLDVSMQTFPLEQIAEHPFGSSATRSARGNPTDGVWIMLGAAIGAVSGALIGGIGVVVWSLVGGSALGIPLILGGVVAPLLGSFAILMLGASNASPESERSGC